MPAEFFPMDRVGFPVKKECSNHPDIMIHFIEEFRQIGINGYCTACPMHNAPSSVIDQKIAVDDLIFVAADIRTIFLQKICTKASGLKFELIQRGDQKLKTAYSWLRKHNKAN